MVTILDAVTSVEMIVLDRSEYVDLEAVGNIETNTKRSTKLSRFGVIRFGNQYGSLSEHTQDIHSEI